MNLVHNCELTVEGIIAILLKAWNSGKDCLEL